MCLRVAAVLSVLIAGGQIAGAAISEPAPQSGSPISVDGFFGSRKIGGVWWFIDPDGKPFYSSGVNYFGGVSIEFPAGPPGSSAYQEQFAEREPASKLWANRFHRWRINTCASVMGNWNGRFPTTPIYRIVLRARYLKVPEAEEFGFLDVYSPEFAQVCDDWAQWAVEPQAENPLIIGWFIDNEFHLPQDEAFQRQFYEVVVFWHFWGGRDRSVVEDVVARFNASQDRYFVRAVAMPGNNLDEIPAPLGIKSVSDKSPPCHNDSLPPMSATPAFGPQPGGRKLLVPLGRLIVCGTSPMMPRDEAELVDSRLFVTLGV